MGVLEDLKVKVLQLISSSTNTTTSFRFDTVFLHSETTVLQNGKQ